MAEPDAALEVVLADKAERTAALEALAQQRADELAQGKQREQKVRKFKARERDGYFAVLHLIRLGVGGRSRWSARTFASKRRLTESVCKRCGNRRLST